MDGSKDLITGIIPDLDTLYVRGGSLLVRLIDRRLLVRLGVMETVNHVQVQSAMIRCDTNIEATGLTGRN